MVIIIQRDLKFILITIIWKIGNFGTDVGRVPYYSVWFFFLLWQRKKLFSMWTNAPLWIIKLHHYQISNLFPLFEKKKSDEGKQFKWRRTRKLSTIFPKVDFQFNHTSSRNGKKKSVRTDRRISRCEFAINSLYTQHKRASYIIFFFFFFLRIIIFNYFVRIFRNIENEKSIEYMYEFVACTEQRKELE